MTNPLYTSLRDETASNLIGEFGRAATLRKPTGTYNPVEGANTISVVDLAVNVIETSLIALIRGSAGKNQFSEELIKNWDSAIIMSAKETAAAGVEPAVDDELVIGSFVARIAWIEPVAPSGSAIIYKMAISRL